MADNATLTPEKTFGALLEAVADSGQLGFAPVENGLNGSVAEVIEALGLGNEQFTVLAEYHYRVRNALVANRALGATVKRVLSHPQPLGQCREGIRERYGTEVELLFFASTSEAIQKLAESPDWQKDSVAIGTEVAAEAAGLDILAPDLSDRPDNETRFWLLANAKNPQATDLKTKLPEAAIKTGLVADLDNRPGILADFLTLLKLHGVDLVKIESRPSRTKLGQYDFYLDTAMDLQDEAFSPLLHALKGWLRDGRLRDYRLVGPYRCY